MTLDEILEQWAKDSAINIANLAEEGRRIPQLHHKYLRLLVTSRMIAAKSYSELKQLRLEKHQLYEQGPSKEDKGKYAWASKGFPAKGAATTKKELELYLDADADIIAK